MRYNCLTISLSTFPSRMLILSADRTLDEILDSNPLPVLVQFSEDQEIPPEGRNREGKPFQFLITHIYEEIFIQGNFITDGKSSFLQILIRYQHCTIKSQRR